MSTRITTILRTAAIVGIALTLNTHATLVTELGILDLDANGGINPATGAAWQAGDTYRFIFASSAGRDATSADIADYNTFIQNAANASPLSLGSVTWNALASTSTVDARDNTSTASGTGESFWLLNGTTHISNDYADFYDGHTSPQSVTVSETGGAPLDSGDFTSLWTGSTGTGTKKSNVGGGVPGWLGTSIAVEGIANSRTGLWGTAASASQWIDRFNSDNTIVRGLYGVSEPLTITDSIPEPSSLALFALFGLGLLRRIKRARAIA